MYYNERLWLAGWMALSGWLDFCFAADRGYFKRRSIICRPQRWKSSPDSRESLAARAAWLAGWLVVLAPTVDTSSVEVSSVAPKVEKRSKAARAVWLTG